MRAPSIPTPPLASRSPSEKLSEAVAGKSIAKLTSLEAACLQEMVRLTSGGVVGAVAIQSIAGKKKIVVNGEGLAKLAEASPLMTVPTVIPRSEYGELRGRLEQITARKGDESGWFTITDRITGAIVKCVIAAGNAKLLKKAGGAIGSFVTVTGEIRYGHDVQPTSIVAADLVEIKNFVIPYRDWKPIDITDGVDSVKYVRKLRDG